MKCRLVMVIYTKEFFVNLSLVKILDGPVFTGTCLQWKCIGNRKNGDHFQLCSGGAKPSIQVAPFYGNMFSQIHIWECGYFILIVGFITDNISPTLELSVGMSWHCFGRVDTLYSFLFVLSSCFFVTSVIIFWSRSSKFQGMSGIYGCECALCWSMGRLDDC